MSFLYYNGHGDLAAEAGPVGSRTAAYTYDPFGLLRSGSSGTAASERWTGAWDKKLDATSSIIEMGARPYDPTLGRFLSVDPIEGGSINLYEYAGQDPINAYDLTGECYVPIAGRHSWQAQEMNERVVNPERRALCQALNELFYKCATYGWSGIQTETLEIEWCWKRVVDRFVQTMGISEADLLRPDPWAPDGTLAELLCGRDKTKKSGRKESRGKRVFRALAKGTWGKIVCDATWPDDAGSQFEA